jgi:hypothetical protein
MAKSNKAVSMFAARRYGQNLFAEITELFHNLAKTLYDPYRPELHYMRGPGPKWHAKHDPATSDLVAIPVLVRVRAKR